MDILVCFVFKYCFDACRVAVTEQKIPRAFPLVIAHQSGKVCLLRSILQSLAKAEVGARKISHAVSTLLLFMVNRHYYL